MRTLFLSLAGMALAIASVQAIPLPVGSPAPSLTALNQDGKPVNLGDIYAHGTTLVYFYPKSFTGGCTAEACSLRDAYTTLQTQGLQIIGVSRDGAPIQAKFQQQYHLPFTLIADTDGKVAAAFGVPSVVVSARESFLVKDGKIVWNSPHAQTKGSAEEVEKALASLK
jgi:peroxiredoxin Q/BCP